MMHIEKPDTAIFIIPLIFSSSFFSKHYTLHDWSTPLFLLLFYFYSASIKVNFFFLLFFTQQQNSTKHKLKNARIDTFPRSIISPSSSLSILVQAISVNVRS